MSCPSARPCLTIASPVRPVAPIRRNFICCRLSDLVGAAFELATANAVEKSAVWCNPWRWSWRQRGLEHAVALVAEQIVGRRAVRRPTIWSRLWRRQCRKHGPSGLCVSETREGYVTMLINRDLSRRYGIARVEKELARIRVQSTSPSSITSLRFSGGPRSGPSAATGC